ncbi:ATP-binding protein [Parapedobacter deserti]|uniref:histidine kinase n=1 Tax=Parapedobacter deserti TaxID=1912957 RepID=A0ABV7JFI3_9SPHI
MFDIYFGLIESSPTPMCFFVGDELRIEVANPAMLATWGKDETVLGKSLLEALPEMEGQPFPAMLRTVLDTGIPMRGDAARARHEVNGELVTSYYDFSYTPMTTGKKIRGIAVILHDVTAQVMVRQSRDRFLSVLSHEFNTPLTAVMACGQLAERELLTGNYGKCQRLIYKMNDRMRKLASLVDSLLSVASSERSSPAAQSSFSCIRAVNEVLGEMRLRDRVQVYAAEDVTVYASFSNTKEILKSLIDNAVRFSPAENSVSLTVDYLNGDIVKFTVKDKGVGLSKEEHTRIFRKYYKSTNNDLAWQKGLGIGLFKAANLVQAEGGQIWAESDGLNKGATFCFTLRSGENTPNSSYPMIAEFTPMLAKVASY